MCIGYGKWKKAKYKHGICCLTMGLFQLCRNIYTYDKNRMEVHANKNSCVIVLVLEGIQKFFQILLPLQNKI